MKYLFQIGRNETLSRAELASVFPAETFGQLIQEEYLEIDLPTPLVHPQKSLDSLGGVIKILEVVQENVKREDLEKTVGKFLEEHFEKQQTDGRGKKWKFGLSMLSKGKSLERKKLQKLLMALKKTLREKHSSIRFVNKNFMNVSAVTAFHENLVNEGVDGWLFLDEGILARTAAVQNIQAYGLRDYGKPFRDPKAGMLPPKLAQIMINLAIGPLRTDQPTTIIDPFCGTGTILMEALLMGLHVYGYDMDPIMVEGSRQNLAWFFETFQKMVSRHTSGRVSPALAGPHSLRSCVGVQMKDARTLDEHNFYQENFPKPIAIVTESSLGPPLRNFPSREKIEQIQEELSALHISFFENARKYLRAGTPVVMTFPVFIDRKPPERYASGRWIEKIERLGYSKTALSQFGTLFYERPDSVVGREIVKFIAR